MKAFIFDLDGVIVFTDKFHYQAWKKMADRMGIYFDEVINNRLRGVSRAESLEIILEKCEEVLTEEKKAELMEEKNNTYRGAEYAGRTAGCGLQAGHRFLQQKCEIHSGTGGASGCI